MKIADLTNADKGREVIFHHHHGERDSGILSSWNEHYVFCRFTSGSTAAACDPEQLTFANEGNTK